MRPCVTHGISGSSGIQLLPGVQNNVTNITPLPCSLFCCFQSLCFLLNTFGQRRPHFWPNRFWSRCDLCFGLSSIHPKDAESRGSVQFSERILCPSMFNKSIIDTALIHIVQVGSCSSHDFSVFLTELGMMTLAVHTVNLWA